MDREMLQLQQLFTDNSDVCIIKCGIGKVNAALGAQRLINEFHPQVIISTGCAGGHGEGISIQDVVVSSELCYHDVYCGDAAGGTVFGQVQGLPARFQADPVLLQKAQQLSIANSQLSIHAGLIVTGDWFVDSKDKMREIVGRFPECKAVDMESAAIAQTCLLNRCASSPSASSATCHLLTLMPPSTTTSGTPWLTARSRSPRPLWKACKRQELQFYNSSISQF